MRCIDGERQRLIHRRTKVTKDVCGILLGRSTLLAAVRRVAPLPSASAGATTPMQTAFRKHRKPEHCPAVGRHWKCVSIYDSASSRFFRIFVEKRTIQGEQFLYSIGEKVMTNLPMSCAA